MHNFTSVLKGFNKRATAVLTPEAMQAALQPPMDPAAGGMPGGAPMDPAAMGGTGAPAPMPPDAAAGMPPAGGAAVPQGSGGGEIPPEITQDQLFMQFMMAMGVQFDPQTGTFVDPNGQPLSVDEVMQIYDMFQQQVAAQGGAPGAAAQAGVAPVDPAMAGAPMDPAAGGAPVVDPGAAGMEAAPAGEVAPGMEGVDPNMELPPDLAAGGAPGDAAAMGGTAAAMDPMAAGAGAPMGDEDPVMAISSAVMTGVESVLEDFMAGLEKKMAEMADRIETLSKALESLQDTTDRRSEDDKDAARAIEDDLAADLNPAIGEPVAEPVPLDMGVKTASTTPITDMAKSIVMKPEPANLFSFICQQRG